MSEAGEPLDTLQKHATCRVPVSGNILAPMGDEMTEDETRILKQALKLPSEARAALAGYLLDSLDAPPDPGVEAAWESEIAIRARQVDSSSVQMIPWSEARRKIGGG
ncbi:MAG TPA: addiction module protein [bacterium]|nr:addiction module protein [bacterium]